METSSGNTSLVERAKGRAAHRLAAGQYSLGVAVVREITEPDRDDARLYEIAATEDGQTFASVKVVVPGGLSADPQEIETAVEKFAGDRFPREDRLGTLLRASEQGPLTVQLDPQP